jgi:hypothetical protein
MPDFGFLNAGESVDNARRIIRAVDRPVIDGDTGYGNPLSVETSEESGKLRRSRHVFRRSSLAETMWTHAGQDCDPSG